MWQPWLRVDIQFKDTMTSLYLSFFLISCFTQNAEAEYGLHNSSDDYNDDGNMHRALYRVQGAAPILWPREVKVLAQHHTTSYLVAY